VRCCCRWPGYASNFELGEISERRQCPKRGCWGSHRNFSGPLSWVALTLNPQILPADVGGWVCVGGAPLAGALSRGEGGVRNWCSTISLKHLQTGVCVCVCVCVPLWLYVWKPCRSQRFCIICHCQGCLCIICHCFLHNLPLSRLSYSQLHFLLLLQYNLLTNVGNFIHCLCFLTLYMQITLYILIHIFFYMRLLYTCDYFSIFLYMRLTFSCELLPTSRSVLNDFPLISTVHGTLWWTCNSWHSYPYQQPNSSLSFVPWHFTLTRTHTHTDLYSQTHIHTCAHSQPHICVHTHAHTYIHTQIHTHLHIHINTHSFVCTAICATFLGWKGLPLQIRHAFCQAACWGAECCPHCWWKGKQLCSTAPPSHSSFATTIQLHLTI
jgi:hypothetical protein